MYHFSKPLKTIIRETRQLQRRAEDAYILVLAELSENKGHNNTMVADENSTEAIAMAIGFSCGSAFRQIPRYRNA